MDNGDDILDQFLNGNPAAKRAYEKRIREAESAANLKVIKLENYINTIRYAIHVYNICKERHDMSKESCSVSHKQCFTT
jgi:hypothetical protein